MKPTAAQRTLYAIQKAARRQLDPTVRQRDVKYRTDNLEATRKSSRECRRRKLGLPMPLYAAPSCCEICRKPFVKEPHLDHCHLTDRFRGWLCGNCNRALGLLLDSAAVCRRAAAYLECTL